ncbi:DUF4132 domain-containing protein [Cytophagaceae bacterium DM2B3-1]|uniref:DUF4132 domain-containing protein n=1 Tax=Xanthocytophaga flava TaxID=3048013 RepID=A0ABT7CSJ8_9BACT|nr:DUF4132 domain-containing protein [Xanthocytophaga flavus]MDJ1471476.1 DUF4132 domain-containing protein [Xanthocytophaga flavus]MDJ1496675.1 DUF4132 domain-containing protein [Xanthocytophaga flavus]
MEITSSSDAQAKLQQSIAALQKTGKLDKPLISWWDDAMLPPLYTLAGNTVDPLSMKFLFYHLSKMKREIPDEANLVLDQIDKSRSVEFALKVLELFVQNRSDNKEKYCLILVSQLGNESMLPIVKKQITDWVERQMRLQLAITALDIFTTWGTPKSYRTIYEFAKKYKTKKRNVGKAATAIICRAAEKQGLTEEQFTDRLMPDFGFEGSFRYFDVEGQTYRAYIDMSFKLAYQNEEGKPLKSFPKNTPKELQSEFKEINKEIKGITQMQNARLTNEMILQTKRTATTWSDLFQGNPILFAYAMRLVWGEYDANKLLKQTFVCQEDGSLLNVHEEEIVLNESSFVGLVHPILLEETLLQHWKQKFYESDLTQPFAQLHRPLITVPEELKTQRMDTSFQDKKVNGYQIFGLEKTGWARGSVVDSGAIASYQRSFSELEIIAIIETEGIGIGYYNNPEATLGKAYFVRTRSTTIWEVHDEKDNRLIPFGMVPTTVYSEVMSDLQRLITT